MEEIISFTIKDLVNGLIAVCGSITATAAAIAVIVKIINHAKTPDRVQNERIAKLEIATKEQGEYLCTDRKRLDGLDMERRLIMKALLALLAHGIDGNDIKAMQEVKGELTTLLINK